MLLEISRNSRENTCARAYFLIKLQASEHFFTKRFRTTASACSYFAFCLVFQLDSYRENFYAEKKERQKLQEKNGELQNQLEQLKIQLEQQQKKWVVTKVFHIGVF